MSDSSGSSEGSFVEQVGKLGCQILQGLMVGLLSSLGLGTWEAWVSDSLPVQGLGVDWFVEQVGVGQLGKLGCQILQGVLPWVVQMRWTYRTSCLVGALHCFCFGTISLLLVTDLFSAHCLQSR